MSYNTQGILISSSIRADTYYVKPTSPIPAKLFVKVLENADNELSVVITDGNSFVVPE